MTEQYLYIKGHHNQWKLNVMAFLKDPQHLGVELFLSRRTLVNSGIISFVDHVLIES